MNIKLTITAGSKRERDQRSTDGSTDAIPKATLDLSIFGEKGFGV
jgi:hypothetical protein